MNIEDRGIIKWQPFNSCFNADDVIEDIKTGKNREIFPTLSDDQLTIIAEEIITAFNLKTSISFEYYYDGKINKIKGIIEQLDWQKKRLYINKIPIYFKQILKVNEL